MRGLGAALGNRQRFRASGISSRSCSGQAGGIWPPGTRYWEEHQQNQHAPQPGHFPRVSYPPPPPPPPALPPQRGMGVMLGGAFPPRPGLPPVHGEAGLPGTGFAPIRPPPQPFHQDPGLGYVDPSEAFSGLVDSFYRKGLFQEIDQVFRGMKAAQILVAVPTYRMLIELYSQLRDFEKMDMVYVEMKKAMMKSAGHQLSESSPQQKMEASDHFTALLDACYRRGMFQEVQQVYRAMKAAQLTIPVPAYTIVIETQFQLKNWAAMDSVWMEMKEAVRKSSAGGTSTSWGAAGTLGGLPPPASLPPPPPGVHHPPPRPVAGAYPFGQAPGDGLRQFQHPFHPPSSFHAPPLPPQGGPPGVHHFSAPPPPPGPPPPFHPPAGHQFQVPPPPPPPPGSGYQFQVPPPPAAQHGPYHFHPPPVPVPAPAAPGPGTVAAGAFGQHGAPPVQEQQVTAAQGDDVTSTEHEVHVEVATMTTMESGGEEQPEQQQEEAEAEAGETANAVTGEEEHEETVAVQEGVDEMVHAVGEDGVESMVTGDHQRQQQQLMESSG